jgi:hypothetical protein
MLICAVLTLSLSRNRCCGSQSQAMNPHAVTVHTATAEGV